MEALIPLLLKIDNVAVLVLVIIFLWREWRNLQERKDDRAERQVLVQSLEKVGDALHRMEVVIAAITGKAQ